MIGPTNNVEKLESYELEAHGYPRLRVTRVRLNGAHGYDVYFLDEEWRTKSEGEDMCSWLQPVVQAACDLNEANRPFLVVADMTPRALAFELLKLVRTFATRGVLYRDGLRGRGPWRFTAGPPRSEPSRRQGGGS